MKKPTKETIKFAISNWGTGVKLYFNNLWDALLGRTQGFIDESYTIIDGVSQQAFELMLEKERLQQELAEALNRLGKKPAKKTATTARKAPKKKPSGK